MDGRVFAAIGCVFIAGLAISELIGLRNTEIIVSDDGLSTPHGFGRRHVFLSWDEVSQVEVFPIRRGEIMALTRRNESAVRIGLREVDRPDDLVSAVKARLDRMGDVGA